MQHPILEYDTRDTVTHHHLPWAPTLALTCSSAVSSILTSPSPLAQASSRPAGSTLTQCRPVDARSQRWAGSTPPRGSQHTTPPRPSHKHTRWPSEGGRGLHRFQVWSTQWVASAGPLTFRSEITSLQDCWWL